MGFLEKTGNQDLQENAGKLAMSACPGLQAQPAKTEFKAYLGLSVNEAPSDCPERKETAVIQDRLENEVLIVFHAQANFLFNF